MRSHSLRFHVSAALMAASVGLSTGGIARADADDSINEPIDQIVVVAHKDERSVREIAANVTVISRTDLNNELAVSLADMFRYVPGVDYEAAGTRFGTEGISIRGIGGNRVAILVDGVPMPDQFDTGSFSNATRDFIDAGIVRDIEVLHGPASALYGSAAIGGVMAVRTPDPSDIVRGSGFGGEFLGTWRAADNSQHAQTQLAIAGPSIGVMAGLSWRDGSELDSAALSDNIDTRSDQRSTAMLKLVADDHRGDVWRAAYIHQQSDTVSALNSVLGTGRYRSTTALLGDDESTMDLINVSYEFGEPGGWIDSAVVRGFYETASIRQHTLDERALARTPVSINRLFSYEQDIHGLEFNAWKDLGGDAVAHRLGVGIEYRNRVTEELRDGLSTDLTTGQQTNVLLGEAFPLRDFPISTTRETAVFVEDTMTFGDWTVIAAVRADKFELSPDVDSLYLEDYPSYEPVSLSESDLSPKLGVILKVSPEIDLFAQFSHGFRAPPYSDANVSLDIPFFAYRAIPNPDLKSESSNGIDIGLRWQGLRSSARVSAFRTRYDNFIESKVNLGLDPVSGYTLFQSQNIEKTTIEGLEVGWAIRLGRQESFEFDGSAYFARGDNDVTDRPLNSVGPAEGVVGLSWFSNDDSRQVRLKATLTEAYDRRDESSGEVFKPAGFAVFDLLMTQKLGDNVSLRAGIYNLADRTYWNWSDVRGFSPDDPILATLARPGRNASLSVSVAW